MGQHMDTEETILSIRNLYKIFGARPVDVLPFVRDGMGKDELLAEHKHVLGLNDINVDMKRGEITVIMGLSGSGKSTLIRHLNRLIEPTAGEIVFEGTDVMELGSELLRKLRREHMSMVFQRFALLPHKTIVENAAMPLQVRGLSHQETLAEARRWLDRVGLDGYADYIPDELSGGMQQRVGIARALASNSSIMLMDEAFSALDPLIRTDMQNLLLELQEELKKTIVFITHDLDEALKLADHLVILKDGAVVQQGEPQSILLEPDDPYIVDFISDINRARVLRVRSVMEKTAEPVSGATDAIGHNENLESVVLRADGDVSKSYRVVDEDNAQVGILHMSDLVRALVPTGPSTKGPTEARR